MLPLLCLLVGTLRLEPHIHSTIIFNIFVSFDHKTFIQKAFQCEQLKVQVHLEVVCLRLHKVSLKVFVKLFFVDHDTDGALVVSLTRPTYSVADKLTKT